MNITTSFGLGPLLLLTMVIAGCGDKEAADFLSLFIKQPSEIDEIQLLDLDLFSGWPTPSEVQGAAIVSVLNTQADLSDLSRVLKTATKGETHKNHPATMGTYAFRVRWRGGDYYLFCRRCSDKDGEFILIQGGSSGETNVNRMQTYESRDLPQLLQRHFGTPKS
jgi:hypothetical protein